MVQRNTNNQTPEGSTFWISTVLFSETAVRVHVIAPSRNR